MSEEEARKLTTSDIENGVLPAHLLEARPITTGSMAPEWNNDKVEAPDLEES